MMLCRTEIPNNRYKVTFIEPITEQEEERLDKSKLYYGETTYKKDDKNIDSKNIYFYGDIDFNNDDDIKAIKHYHLIDDTSIMYTNFNYELGNADISEGVKTSLAVDPIKWFKYCYCLIGKPKRVIVYNDIVFK